MIIPPNNSQRIASSEGFMQPPFRLWTAEMSRLDILQGAGSPEGVVSALQKRIYMDTAGTAGSILYIKRDTDIAGDDSKGWILI